MKKLLLILLLACLSVSLFAQRREAITAQYPGKVFGWYGNSEIETRQQGGVPTAVTFSGGKGAFNGSTSNIVMRSVWKAKTVRIRITSLASTTQSILALSATHSISVSGGTVTATGFASPTIYVNGVVSSTVTTGASEICITTATGINANTFVIGRISTLYLNGSIDLIEAYNRTLTVGEIKDLYTNVQRYSIPINDDNISYGVRIDNNQTDPAVARIGNLSKHISLPIQSKMKGCIVNDAGNVVYYLNPTDWTKKANGEASKLDGADGQVMVEVPTFYWQWKNTGQYSDLRISEVNLYGYTKSPKFYIGAYKMALSGRDGASSTWKGVSVVNMSTDYRGGGNANTWDGTYRTLLGKPATSLTRDNFRVYSARRGYGWTQCLQWQHDAIFRLFLVEYATRNSQAAVPNGLGAGVTTVSSADWNSYNTYYPLIPCGTSNSLGNLSGEVTYAIPSFPGATGTVKVNRYRGIENPFGDIWEFLDGVNVYVDAAFNGEIYTSDGATLADNTSTGYIRNGTLSNVSGWIKSMNAGVLLPAIVGGSATTYFADYFDKSASASVWRVVFVGGSAYNGTAAGFGCTNAISSSSYANANFGGRLCYTNR